MPTTTEHSISDQLVALIRLQNIDSKIDQIKKLRGDLPDEISDMEDEKSYSEPPQGAYYFVYFLSIILLGVAMFAYPLW